MKSKYTIALSQIVSEHALEIVHRSSDYERVSTSNVNLARPSLQLVGFYDYFEPDRIRLWGNTETAFLATLPPERQTEVVNELFSRRINKSYYWQPKLICHFHQA